MTPDPGRAVFVGGGPEQNASQGNHREDAFSLRGGRVSSVGETEAKGRYALACCSYLRGRFSC